MKVDCGRNYDDLLDVETSGVEGEVEPSLALAGKRKDESRNAGNKRGAIECSQWK